MSKQLMVAGACLAALATLISSLDRQAGGTAGFGGVGRWTPHQV